MTGTATERAADRRALAAARVACAAKGCDSDAAAAVRSQRPTRANLWTKVWWTPEEAPAAAQRLCGHHLAELLAALAEVLT